MKTRKRLLALFLSAMLLLSACGGSPAGGETAPEGGGASAPGGSQTEGEGAGGGSELSPAMQAVVDSVTAENAQATGVCGPDIVWYFKDGVLVLEGTGPMTDYNSNTAPWTSFDNEINMIYVSEGITTVGSYIFSFTGQLSRVSLPSTLESIGESAFEWSGRTSVTIPVGVTEIGFGAFYGCNDLETVVLPEGLQCIGGQAFCCDSLKELTIPASVTTIDSPIFSGDQLVFLGDAPTPASGEYDDLLFKGPAMTVIYYGEGFEPYIEAYRDYPSIQWVKG